MRVVLIAVFGLACGGGADKTTDSAPSVEPEPEASEVDLTLVTACVAEGWVRQTCSGCHLAGSHLDLEFNALAALVGTDRELHPGPIVIPGDPDGSLLVRKVEAKVGLVTLEEDEGEPMPLDADITLEDAQLIRDWVAAGAIIPSGC